MSWDLLYTSCCPSGPKMHSSAMTPADKQCAAPAADGCKQSLGCISVTTSQYTPLKSDPSVVSLYVHLIQGS